MKPRVLLRPEWGPSIGMGHVVRCLALAEGLGSRLGADIDFAGTEPDSAVLSRIRAVGGRLVRLPAYRRISEEAENLKQILQRSCYQVVVVDSYRVDAAYLEALEEARCPIVLVDDLAALDRYRCTLLLNGNLYAPELRYAVENGTRCLLGATYLPLRGEVVRHRGESAPRAAAPVRRLLITMGGSDPQNHTLRALRVLDLLDEPAELEVIVGPHNAHVEELRAFAAGSGHRVRVSVDPPDFVRRIASADVAVSAAGCTAYELAYLGIPSVLLAVADNQRYIEASLVAAGAAVSVGDGRQDLSPALHDAVARLIGNPDWRQSLSECARSLFDGKGVERVAAAIAEVI